MMTMMILQVLLIAMVVMVVVAVMRRGYGVYLRSLYIKGVHDTVCSKGLRIEVASE